MSINYDSITLWLLGYAPEAPELTFARSVLGSLYIDIFKHGVDARKRECGTESLQAIIANHATGTKPKTVD